MNDHQDRVPVGAILKEHYRVISEGTPRDIGTAYKAYDMQKDRLVTLLVLAARWGGSTEALERLAEAQRVAASLDSPGLVPIEDAGLLNGQTYLVRTEPEGLALSELLAQTVRLETRIAVEIAIRLCEALAPIHRAGLVHGSLSPYSVLLTEAAAGSASPDYEVALLDAGLLPSLQTEAAASGKPWGRFPYISPEQAAGDRLHPAADVYVIGSLLYLMLAGRPPFRTTDETVLIMQHMRQEPPSLQVLLPDIPPVLAQIVNRALAKEPAARYRNAGQLAQILKSQARSGIEPTPPSRQPESATRAQAREPERLVVPPPVAVPVAQDWPSWEPYDLEGTADWNDQPAGVDWLMIGLLIAALIAVLGLIPLWRTVYRRYAAPSSISLPAPHHDLEHGERLTLLSFEGRVPATRELDKPEFVWYNQMPPSPRVARMALRSGDEIYSFMQNDRFLCLGVQLTGLAGKT
jgi:serine/threonine protein kinase